MDALLFLSSYALMFIALSFRFDEPRLKWSCIGLAAAGILGARYIIRKQSERTPQIVTLTRVQDIGPDVSGYIATYLMPIIVVGTPTTGDLIAYGITLCAIGFVYVRSRMVQLNPTLYFCGYSLFGVETRDGFKGYLLTGQEPKQAQRYKVLRRGDILFDTGVRVEAESSEEPASS